MVNLISREENNVGPMLKYYTLGLNIVFFDTKRKNNKETSKETSKQTNKNRFPWPGKITISIISISINYQLLIKNRNLFVFFFFLLPLTNDLLTGNMINPKRIDIFYVIEKLVIACLPWQYGHFFPCFSYFAVISL